MNKNLIVAAIGLVLAGPAMAESVKSEVTATNGVVVTVYSDDFAGRHEYSAPSVDFQDGYVLVSRVDAGGDEGSVSLRGSFIYSGDWRYYDAAIFRGGEEANFVENGRRVGQCHSSRYSRPSCTLIESFVMTVSAEQLAKHARDGKLEFQIRAGRTARSTMVSVPVTYFEAVQEVAEARQ